MGPNRVCVSFRSPEDGNIFRFQNIVFSSYLEFRTMEKSMNPINLSVIHHRQNPFDSTFTVLRNHRLDYERVKLKKEYS
jgi:hypothetical protein